MTVTGSPNVGAEGTPYFVPKPPVPAGTAIDPQPTGKEIPAIFKPLTIRGVTFQNRVWLAPLCQYSSTDGVISPWHMAHIGGIASRGPGLSFVEATAVSPEGRITPEDAGIWDDKHTKAWADLITFVHSQGQKIGIQLAHAGRKASTIAPWILAAPTATAEQGGWPEDVVGPSTEPFHPAFAQPKELSIEGIKKVVADFVAAAKRAVAAGFDVIEVHSAHGYLLSSFLSPRANKRTDEYGGSFENRIRLTLEVIDAVRAVIPETMPLFVRISGTEWMDEVTPNEPGWTIDDTARLAPILDEHNVDLLDVSTGAISFEQKIKHGPEYQVPFAAAAKKAVEASHTGTSPRLLVGAVGGLFEGKVAEGVLQSGRADVIFVGRGFQKNPGLVWEMADQLGVKMHWASQIRLGFGGRAASVLGSHKPLEEIDDP